MFKQLNIHHLPLMTLPPNGTNTPVNNFNDLTSEPNNIVAKKPNDGMYPTLEALPSLGAILFAERDRHPLTLMTQPSNGTYTPANNLNDPTSESNNIVLKKFNDSTPPTLGILHQLEANCWYTQ